MIQISLEKLAEIVAGQIIGDCDAAALKITGAEFDSRRVVSGQIFLALAGKATHGHAFVNSVKARGAVAALVEDARCLVSANIPGVVVNDSLLAMQQLAAWWRKETGVPVLAITGSVGKTTTKEIAAAVLGTLGPGTFSQASFNNHVGVPYTLLQISRKDKWAVIEIGMNHRGEIAPLSRITAPNVAVVTFIAPAHIGNLGSLRAIAQEKLDIAAGLASDGVLVLNSDSELLSDAELLADINPKPHEIVYFGSRGQAQTPAPSLVIESFSANSNGLAVSFSRSGFFSRPGLSRSGIPQPGKRIECSAPLFGAHHVNNVAAALLGASKLAPKLNLEKVTTAIAGFQVPEQRFIRLKALEGEGEIFDDSYNANPASMRAFFEATKPFCQTCQRWGVVLGEMRELGDFEEQYHREVADLVAQLSPTFVVAVGDMGAVVYEQILRSVKDLDFQRVSNANAAIEALKSRPFEVLLVKGARGLKLEILVRALVGKTP